MALDDRDRFEFWLADMDDALDRFLVSVRESVGSTLNFTPASLDRLQGWLLARYDDHDQMLKPAESETIDGIARYIGETIRRTVGCHWDIELSDPKKAFYQLPILVGFGAKDTPECPHTLATAAAARRTGNYLSNVLAAIQKRYGKAPS
jgi:hypothetical protein